MARAAEGFTFGGWTMPFRAPESREELDRLFNEKFDLLLGRKTYEIFAAYWPYYDETAPAGGIAKLFKGIKKYAVSRSGDELAALSAPARHLRREALEAGRRPKPRSRVSSTGVMIAHYERDGEIRIVDAALAEPSKAEAARQERMKREG